MAEYRDGQYESHLEEDTIGSQHDVESLKHDFAQFDLPLWEYAQLHGLTTDHMSTNPFASDLVPRPPANCAADLEDGSLTTIALLGSLGALNGHTAHEKYDIDKDAAELLASVIKLGQDDNFLDECQDEHSIRFKDLKLEEPILLSDPELDLMRLEQRNTAKICADVMETSKNIQEPGFISPEKDAAMRQALTERKNEKLDIDRSTIDYLGEVCKQLEGDDGDDIDMLLGARKARYPSPETPPLLTSSPFLDAAAPSLEATEMELTSSPEDLILIEAIRIEDKIMDDDSTPSYGQLDAWHRGDETDKAIYDIPPNDSEDSSPPLRRKRLKDLKVEVPLTPEDSIEPPTKKAKTVSFSETLHTMIPPLEPEMAMSEPGRDESGIGDFIENVVKPFAESALKQIEEEQLNEFDTMLRVVVPKVDDFVPNVPWETAISQQTNETPLGSQKLLIYRMKEELDENEKKWSGVQRSERQLPWTPFPARLGQVDGDEELDDGSLAEYLEQLEVDDEPDVESLTCTRNGLKLLQDEDDDLFIEPGEFLNSGDEEAVKIDARREASSPTPGLVTATNTPATVNTDPVVDGRLDMHALLKKRKLELEAANNKPLAPAPASNSTSRAQITALPPQPLAEKPTRFSDLSIAGGGLANFLHLHGGPQSTNLRPNRFMQMQQQQHNPPAPLMTVKKQENTYPEYERNITMPSPEIGRITTAFGVIVSPTILADRDLMRELRSLFPTLEVVARDLLPSKSKEAVQAINNEADITTSPSTGIISTTLQKFKQMPLPGQSGYFGIRDRIALVSSRYDRLLVLVSEGRRQDSKERLTTGPLDSRDIRTISDVVSFATSLENTVEVQFVAGGEPQLVTWLAACISRTVVLDNSINLMQDESIWERTLRQAGLNPFAAQYVLSRLKLKDASIGLKPSSISGTSFTSPFGLAALTQMTASQRTEMFGPAVGPRVVENLTVALDGSFIPSVRKVAA